LKKRKKTDLVCNYQIVNNAKKGITVIDFLLGENKNNIMTIVEFNFYRYEQLNLGNNKKGLIVLAYTKRSYSSDITNFLYNLSSTRSKYLKEIISINMPSIKINDN
jgi:hypothetical protein